MGNNSTGQTTIPLGLSGVKAIAAGINHNLALKNDGTVVAWGNNSTGQTAIPANLNNVVAVRAGWEHSIALKSDGTVVAWGWNSNFQTNMPSGLLHITAIAAGHSHVLGLKNDGTVVAWGWNGDGQANVPAGLSGIVSIAASDRGSYAVKSDGTVVAWGANWYGETTIPSGLSGVTSIAANGYHILAIVPQPHFQIVNGSYTWHQAKADAEARGGRLAVLNTQAKIDESNAFLRGLGAWPESWLGLTDEVQEGQWRWISGDALTASIWSPYEPNGSGNYGLVYGTGHAVSGLWDDQTASYAKAYLLEFPKRVLGFSPTTNGSIAGNGEYDPGSSATLTATANPGYVFTGWTGAASGTQNPLSLTMDADKSVGATFAPDTSDSDGDGLCNYDEVMLYGTNPDLADTDGDGLSDGYELGIGRYTVVLGSRTWAQAQADAVAKGGNLATFATEDEWNRAMLSIGEAALYDVNGLWIGATDSAVEGAWAWITGEPFNYSNWTPGEPNNLNNSDYAAVAGDLGGDLGKWYDFRGVTTRDGYILESGYSTDPLVADVDHDGLNDGQELAAGTSPFAADADGDGLTDAEEVNLTRTNPLKADSNVNGINDAADDQDGDGLSNLAEIRTYGTDPLKADTDGDGLGDKEELVMAGSYFQVVAGSFTRAQAVADATSKRGRLAAFPNTETYSTIIAKLRRTATGYLWLGLDDAATEGVWKWSDGSSATYNRWLTGQPNGGTAENYAVVMENLTTWADATADFTAAGYIFERVGLDPLNTDTDSDGASDGVEVKTYGTDPFNEDTDGDGLSDGAEINTHQTDPKQTDTDGDGISDRVEVQTYQTNPLLKDTDGDGFDDLFEINTGFNPVLASSSPDAVSSIRTAMEFRFNAGAGQVYRVESSTDLQNWTVQESNIVGQGGEVTRFYSIENQPKRYFRVRRN
jgi:uncharacterized repeat protein (TIGR02543 family)